MFDLEWNKVGEHKYETGLDRGVLYPFDDDAVVWNGLISVIEKASTEVAASYYFDGVKYSIYIAPSDFDATLKAFTYPDEFEDCDGTSELLDGVSVDQQARKPFGLSYRTKIGNDVEQGDYGYKVHLVYGARATPGDVEQATIADATKPITFTWEITTIPVPVPGLRPSAHLVIDSTKASPFALNALESILYGFLDDARLPLPSEINDLPWEDRMIIVIASPNTALLPKFAKEGDLVFSQSDEVVYAYGEAGSDTRKVIVVQNTNVNLLPSDSYPGDLVYNEHTGILYKLGE